MTRNNNIFACPIPRKSHGASGKTCLRKKRRVRPTSVPYKRSATLSIRYIFRQKSLVRMRYIRKPSPCLPTNRTLYVVPFEADWFSCVICVVNAFQRVGDESIRPNLGGTYNSSSEMTPMYPSMESVYLFMAVVEEKVWNSLDWTVSKLNNSASIHRQLLCR